MNEMQRLAFSSPVVLRGLRYSVLVGAILVAINHGDAILEQALTPGRWIRIGLTVIVPYCVSVLSSVGATLDAGAAVPGSTERGTAE